MGNKYDDNKIKQLENKVEELQSDLKYLEQFVTKKLVYLIDDKFEALEEYLGIEYNRAVKVNFYEKRKDK